MNKDVFTLSKLEQVEVEELLALLGDVELENKTLIRRTYEFCDEQSFLAANRQKPALIKMRALLEMKWKVLNKQTLQAHRVITKNEGEQ